MRIVVQLILRIMMGAALLIVAGVPVYALPATLSLPRGRRLGLEPLTLADAANQLGAQYPAGIAQVDAARAMVGERMAYCRRNSFDPYPLAFDRGYGYCQQMALALSDILRRLGYEARVVHSLRCQFADGKVTSHAWVRVAVDGRTLDVDALFWDEAQGTIDFSPLGQVMEFTALWRLLGGWGSTAVNAHRYYTTGTNL